MIELIRLLVDSFAKVVQFASTNREKRDLIQLGGRLYNVYIQLADILVLAGQILADLACINESTPSREMREISSRVNTKLARQARNLQAVAGDMSALDRELIVLNADCRIKLDGLLRDKHSLINVVLSGLRADNVPLGTLTERDYADLLAEVKNGTPGSTNSVRYFFQIMHPQFYIRPEEQSWIAAEFPTYVDRAQVVRQAEEIGFVLVKLRTSLENAFKVSDMMLYVSRENKRRLKQ